MTSIVSFCLCKYICLIPIISPLKLEMYDNDSTANSESTPNTSNFSNIASPLVKTTPGRPKRTCCKSVVLDEDPELDPTPNRLIAAKGQKTAVERFEKIRSK